MPALKRGSTPHERRPDPRFALRPASLIGARRAVSFFKRSFSPLPSVTITGPTLLLRTPEMGDYEEWASLRAASRAFLAPWEPVWAVDELTRGSFRLRIKRLHKDIEEDEAYPFFIFRMSDNRLVGGLTLSNLRRGAAQMASLGYWMGEAYAGKGYMSAAVRLTTAFAFAKLDLRRIEAACLPQNTVSIRLLEATGFKREGYARQYLNIAGQWSDHLLYALLQSDQTTDRRF
ncbi:MAG: GNAT family N-acetyltransferase [Beijerinckiaceae bacterium]|nr:GNAT family N-acetyltransferase [Beijerinckiaceae bacterium]